MGYKLEMNINKFSIIFIIIICKLLAKQLFLVKWTTIYRTQEHTPITLNK